MKIAERSGFFFSAAGGTNNPGAKAKRQLPPGGRNKLILAKPGKHRADL
jgi:hypothetical protein